MNPLNYLFRFSYNKDFRKYLHNHVWNDVSRVLTLSGIPKLEIIGQAEWTDGHDVTLEELTEEYDSEGNCRCELYPFVSKKLRYEYDICHSLIRAYIEGCLYNYLPKNRNDSFEEDLD